MLLAALACMLALAQAPTGIITGTLTDESGAVIPNATVTITNKAEGVVARTATTDAQGYYSAPSLPAGDYEVRAEVSGFRTVQRDASVLAGSTTTVNMPMTLGATKEVVTVEAASSQINYETHNIQGVIDRSAIQDLPLNGRSYLQLAQLEPGVTIGTGTPGQFNALFTVSVLGAGNRTVITIDGGNVSDNVTTAGGISSMNFSQETVQEFQLSEVNFDLSTPVAAGGAINVVTRSGSNTWHGSAYFFFRDHNMAAYPNLIRSPADPNPFFARRNPGAWLGGPIIKDKLFFFFNYEYQNQVQALATQTTSPFLAPLTGTYGSPYAGKTLSARFDYHLNSKNNFFLRYSHDGNSGFAQALEFGDPSNWAHNTNWADQSIIGWTSTLTPTLVNDLRFQFNYWTNANLQAVPSDCSAPCVAGTLPSVFTFLGSNLPATGPNFDAPQARTTRRYEMIEALSWQKGSHRLKFGADLNPTRSYGLWGFCTPMCVGAFSPDYLNATFGPTIAHALFPAVPTTFKTDSDVLNLPVLNIASSLFSGIPVGSVATPAPYDRSQNEWANQYRAYFQDVWKIKPNFTVNYGLAWNTQNGFYNSDLAKPQFLAPILGTGSNNLGPTVNNTKEFQPAFGFAWSPGKSQKWVIRGGGGIYWDSTPYYYKLRESPVIGPLGDGRVTLAASAFTNNIAGPFGGSGVLQIGGSPSTCPIPGLPCSVVPIGAPIPLGALTTMSVGQFVNLVNQELPTISAKLFPSTVQTSGPYTTTGIDVAKQGVEIYPTHFPLARSYQTSIGVQRDLGLGMVVTADWARRQGENVSLGEQDLNHFNLAPGPTTAGGPVIPTCTKSQLFVPGQECSTGPITFWTDQGRAVYDGLLVKVAKRLEHRYQFTASYALQKGLTDTVNPWNYVNWMASYGEYLPHHNLNIAGLVQLPWGFEFSLNSSIISRTPETAVVPNLVLPGTSPINSNEPLPGLAFNCLNAGCGKTQLANAVNAYNQANPNSQLALPSNYALSSPVFSQDIRLTKTFVVKERYRFTVLAEMFNALNISNLTIGTYQLDAKNVLNPAAQTYSFGQPTGRVTQTFGSGGPRALQVGARFSF
jgi:carboxypeptidase family protein